MRKVVVWGGTPVTAVLAGVAMWFVLTPGRSGAG
jgi:hypothetical protein